MRLLLLLSLLAFATTSSFAQTVTVFRNFACGLGQSAYVTGTGAGCGVPSIFSANPTYTRCPSFTFVRRTVSVTVGATTTDTNTFTCSTFPSLCPQSFSYVIADVSGALSVALLCQRYSAAGVATAACGRVGGTYVSVVSPLIDTCVGFTCPSTGCNPSTSNCRLVSSANSGGAALPCTAVGSQCLNFRSSNSYAGYACGVPCNALACYDTVPGVQVCDAANNRCAVCTTGIRTSATTCSGAISGSQAPQRRREMLLKERKDKIAREHALCPEFLQACRVGFGRDGAYECLDTQSELESCGGCTSTGMGTDCSSLAGVRMGAATCHKGRCVVSACRPGFTLKDGRCL